MEHTRSLKIDSLPNQVAAKGFYEGLKHIIKDYREQIEKIK